MSSLEYWEIKSGYYLDNDRYCPFCDKYTKQKCKDSDHERDSTGDRAECLECGADYNGYSGKYEKNDNGRNFQSN